MIYSNELDTRFFYLYAMTRNESAVDGLKLMGKRTNSVTVNSPVVQAVA
jgi:hypothetical protein